MMKITAAWREEWGPGRSARSARRLKTGPPRHGFHPKGRSGGTRVPPGGFRIFGVFRPFSVFRQCPLIPFYRHYRRIICACPLALSAENAEECKPFSQRMRRTERRVNPLLRRFSVMLSLFPSSFFFSSPVFRRFCFLSLFLCLLI